MKLKHRGTQNYFEIQLIYAIINSSKIFIGIFIVLSKYHMKTPEDLKNKEKQVFLSGKIILHYII
jgi:hypothetical protein